MYRVEEITEKQAREICMKLRPKGLFLFRHLNYFVAIDNASGEAWERAFTTREEAVNWHKSI